MMCIFRMLLVMLSMALVGFGHAAGPHTSTLLVTAAHAPDGVADASLTARDASSTGEAALGEPTPPAAEGGAADPVGLLHPEASAPPSSRVSAWPGPPAGPDWMAPYLDGPQRPPRALLVLA